MTIKTVFSHALFCLTFSGNFFGSHKGFDPLNTEDHDELGHLNSDSDAEEYSATTHKA